MTSDQKLTASRKDKSGAGRCHTEFKTKELSFHFSEAFGTDQRDLLNQRPEEAVQARTAGTGRRKGGGREEEGGQRARPCQDSSGLSVDSEARPGLVDQQRPAAGKEQGRQCRGRACQPAVGLTSRAINCQAATPFSWLSDTRLLPD